MITDARTLAEFSKDFAEALAGLPLPPGELRIVIKIEKDWSGDREVVVTIEDAPSRTVSARRRDPNPIQGHKLATLSFMRPRPDTA